MKPLKLNFLSVITIIFLCSCSKEQKTINNIEGIWDVEQTITNGNTSSYVSSTMEFKSCKAKEDNCTGNYKTIWDDLYTNDNSFIYKVSDNGEKITLNINENDSTISIWDLDVDLDKDDLNLSGRVNNIDLILILKRQ